MCSCGAAERPFVVYVGLGLCLLPCFSACSHRVGFAGVHLWVLCSKVGMSPSEKSNSSGRRPGSAHLTSSENSPSSSLGVGLVGTFPWGIPKETPFYNLEQSHSILQQTEREAWPGVGGLLPLPQAGYYHLTSNEPDPDFPKGK